MGVLADRLTQYVSDQVADDQDAASGKSSTRRELEAGGRDFLGESASGLAALTGSSTLQNFADDQAKTSARLRNPARDTYVQSFDDVHGVSDLASYVGHLGLSSAPTIATMALGGAGGAGLAARGLSDAARIAAASRIAIARGAGALATQELPSVGRVADTQRAAGEDVDLPSSIALGTANNALNLLGVEGGVIRGLPRSALASRTARAVVGGAQTAAEQAVAATGQQATLELGRRAVDDDYDILNPEAQKRYKEAAIGGALMGGAIGGVHGGIRAPLETKAPDADPVDIANPAKQEAQRQLTGPAPAEPGAITSYPSGDLATPDTKSAVGDDFFTGATVETLRPSDGVASIARAIRAGGKDTAIVHDLTNNISKALAVRDVPTAEQAILDAEAHVSTAKIKPEQRQSLARSFSAARDIVASYTRAHEELAPGRLASEAKPATPDPIPASYDALRELQTMVPEPVTPPKIDAVRAAIAPKSDPLGRKLVSELHAAMSKNAPDEIGEIMSRFAARVEAGANDTNIKPETVAARQRMLEGAERVVSDHQALHDKYQTDSKAYEALLDEATAPPDAPPSASALADKAREVAKPGAVVALPPVNNVQSEMQARQQNADAQNARGTPQSGNQTQARADLLHEAMASGEKNVRGVFQQLLKASYPDDPKVTQLTPDEVRAIIKHVQDRKNQDLAVKMGQKLEGDLDSAMIPEPEPDTQDTTLGVEEKAAKPEPTPAAPKPAKVEPAQGEMFSDRQMRPVGRTKEERFAKEQLLRKAVTGELADRPAEPKSDQLPMFQNNKRPTVYAEGKSRITSDFRVEEARRQQGSAAKAVLDMTDDFVKKNPTTKPELVTKIARLVTERKFKAAATLLEHEKTRVHELEKKKPKVVDMKPEELSAREARSALMRDYENEVGVKAVDKIDKHLEKGEFDKAQQAANKERSRIEKMITDAGVAKPSEAANIVPKASRDKTPAPETPAEPAYAGNLTRDTVNRAIDRKFADGSLDVEDGKRMYDTLTRNDPDEVKALEAELFPRKGKPRETPARLGDNENAPSMPLEAQEKVAEVESQVKEITRDWGHQFNIEVMHGDYPATADHVETMKAITDLTGDPNSRFRALQIDPNTKHNPSDKPRIIIDASQVRDLPDLKATVYHEALGHAGLRGAYKGRLDDILMDIYKKNPEFRAQVRDRIQETANGSRLGPLDEILYHAEEALVEMSHNGTLEKAPFFTRIKTAVQLFARRLGIRKGEFTADEVRAIVRKGQDYATRGKPTPPNDYRDKVNLKDETGDRSIAARRAGDTRTDEQRTRDFMEKLGKSDTATSMAITLQDMGKRALQGMMFGRDLVDYLKPLLPSYGRYHELLQEKTGIVNDYTRNIDQLQIEANRLKDPAKLSTFMRQATMAGKWGYQPDWLTMRTPDGKVKPQMVSVDKAQKAEWDKLDPETQSLADRFFKQGFQAREELREAVRAEREGETADALKSARNTTERREVERQARRAARLFDNKVPSLAGPYIPLSRFGSYVSVAKSPEYAALEAEQNKTAAQKEQLDELRSDPNHFVFSMHDSMGQAEGMEQHYKSLGFKDTYSSPKEEYYRGVNEAPYLQMQKLKQMVQDSLGVTDKFDRKTVHHINSMLRDLYYSSLAEDSARKHDLRRDNVAGVKDDQILRAIATKGRADAHHLASLKNNRLMTEQIGKMREEASQKDYQLADRKRGLNEVLARHEQGMQYDETPFQDKATAIASAWYLMTLPRYYIQNSLQTAMVTAPVLSARFGFGKSWGHVFDAYKSLKPVLNSVEKFKDFAAGKFDIDQLNLPKDEADFLKAQRKTGLVDIGLNYDMGYWEGGNSKGSKWLTETNHFLRTKSQQVEVINRVSAGLAAYRLAKSIGMNAEDATGYAQGIISQTHGDYSRTNAPRYLNMLPKVVTQFRKYQMIQLSLLARHAYSAFAGADPKEKWVARKTLGYLLGQTALVTGAFGLPAVQSISYVMSTIWGDENEPADGEQYLRKLIGDNDTANLILKGAPAAAGVDLSSSLGMGNALSVLPYTNFDLSSRKGLSDLAVGAMGPAFGVAQNFADGYGMFKMGDYQKGTEMIMPSGLRAMMRAYRQSTEGVTNKAGDALMKPEELSALQEVLTGMGFTPTAIQDQRRVQAVNKEYDDYFKGRTTQLKFAYTQAAKDGDAETMQHLREVWRAVQDSKKRVGFKPAPLGDLLTAPAQQRRRERDTAGGVQYRSTNRKFIEGSLGQ